MNNQSKYPLPGEVPVRLLTAAHTRKTSSVDMSQVVGTSDILMICLDTLSYDAALREETAGTTPVLNQYGTWEKCQAPGNFTWSSHHAMFAGFLPLQYDTKKWQTEILCSSPLPSSDWGKRFQKGLMDSPEAQLWKDLQKTDMTHGV